MAFNNYLEEENDKPYFTINSLAYYYDKMEGFAKAVEGSAKALNLTKEEVEKRITLYIEQNKSVLDLRLKQWDEKLETFDSSVETLLSEWVEDGTLTHVIDSTLIDEKIAPFAAQLLETAEKTSDKIAELKKFNIKPQYIEFFGSFNRYGLGTPSGIANYAGGNYVLTVTGNSGDSFVTVQSGNIAHAGTTTKWACVIENNDGLFDINQVTGTDGVSKINLYSPLKSSISNKRLGNLHDAVLGQHYTELGYFAFAQHIYFSNSRHVERNQYIAQFKPDATSGKWVSGAYNIYNQVANMKDTDNTFFKIGNKHFLMSTASNTAFVEWEQKIDGEKGYLESYIGLSGGTALVEFFKDGVLSEQKIIAKPANRVIFNYEGVQQGKIRITAQGPFPTNQGIYIGLTTWWRNEKFQEGSLIKSDDKVVYIGDSWGEYHNKATTRELRRLMESYGGKPEVLNFSKGGHTSTYAVAWFDEYVIANKPDKVIIEYFTNDFNNILNSTDAGTFINPAGQSQSMKISTITQYISNIQYMVDKAIENGIQPIVIMPASTNSETQAQNFANYAVQLWQGKSTIVENPSFNQVSAELVVPKKITSPAGGAVGDGTLPLSSKQVSSSAREGVISDTDTGANVANGYLHTFKNNGVFKSGIWNDGRMDIPSFKLLPQSNGLVNNANNEGIVYMLKNAATSNAGQLAVVVQLADGSYVTKKIQLID